MGDVTALLALLTSSAGQWAIGAATVLATILAAYVKGRLSGAALERKDQLAKEAAGHAKDMLDLEDAARAGAAVHPDDSLSDDPYNRD